MQGFETLRKELGDKLDRIHERLDKTVHKDDHAMLEERVRKLEIFKAYAYGAMAAAGVAGGIIGTVVGWTLKVIK